MISAIKLKTGIIVFIAFYCGNVLAQVRLKTAVLKGDTLFIDSVAVSAFSLKVTQKNTVFLSGIDYRMLEGNTKLVFIQKPLNDTFQLEYMRFPEWLVAEKSHRKPLIYNDYGQHTSAENIAKNQDESAGKTLTTEGILLRGISFGNAQDLVLNSSLNLRMYGKINKDISLEAAVTDQEFPFQPEGTTTTLQDFDRIYVLLKMPKINVLLGDHVFQNSPQLLFMKYAKKDRGLDLSGTDTVKKSIVNWEFSAALARGRFQRNEINGIEGLQGPYRLNGARGEQFIIVVSGTEAVFLDGKKMERGLQADYVIDYNSGEITFTPKHIITAFSRIVVEFQYSDRAYTRSVLGATLGLRHNKWDYTAAVYSEQDAPNQPIQQDLQAYDSASGLTAKEILQKSGDNISQAVISSVHKNAYFNPSVPNYILKDSAGIRHFVYIASADTHRIFYTINFTYLGPAKGHYVLKGTVANGKAYQYIGEINGLPAGDYEPITQLRAPGRISMAEAGVKYAPAKGTVVGAHVAASSNEKNALSNADDKDNNGLAMHLSVNDFHKFKPKDTASKWYIKSSADVEQTSTHFTSIERYRDVEFGRQWNRLIANPAGGTDPQGSSYAKATVLVANGEKLQFSVAGGNLLNSGNNSVYGNTGIRLKTKNILLHPSAEFSARKVSFAENKFSRLNNDFAFENNGLRIGYNIQKENSQFNNGLGGYENQSYGFLQQTIGLQWNYKQKSLNIGSTERVNQDPYSFALHNSVRVKNFNFDWNSNSKKYGILKLGSVFRTMELLDTNFKNKYANENHLAARVEYNFSKILNIISGNIYFQSQSGREQQRQFAYFEVPAGQGFYAWIDFNKDSVQQVNEFQETPFKDQARYVRLLVPTGKYINAQSTEFNGNIFIQPGINHPERKLKWNNRTTWNYVGKSTDLHWDKRIFPFIEKSADVGILAMNAFARNQAELEALEGKLTLQFTSQWRGNKTFFSSGFDVRKSQTQTLYFRYNVGAKWQLKNTAEYRKSAYSSEFLPANGFAYTHLSFEPAFSFQPSSRFRITANYRNSSDKDLNQTIAQLEELGVQITKSILKGGILDMKITSLNAHYFAATGTPLSYDVLQGFSAGQNFRGIVDLRFSAGKNIQMILSYEGRKTADSRFIHIGRAEARYLF